MRLRAARTGGCVGLRFLAASPDYCPSPVRGEPLKPFERRTEYLTLGWNVIGVFIVIFAAIKAQSVALSGFGLDSLNEIGASTIVIWELNGTGKQRQKRALRLIACSFITLAIYILFQSLRTPYFHSHPATSWLGIIWLFATFAVMVALAIGKKRTGEKLGNPVLLTEGRVTMI